MPARWIASIVTLVVGAGAVLGQTLPDSISAPKTSGALEPPIVSVEERGSAADSRFWFRGEYLLWRVKSAPVPNPLITANADPTTSAALNEPGTTVLFGAGSGQSTGFGWLSGMRFTLGSWLGDDQMFGWEGSGFLLERRTDSFSAATKGGAARVLGIPVNATEPFGVNPAGETSFNSNPTPAVFAVHLNSRLWGAEANGVVNLWQNERLRVVGIVGFRYLDLLENLTLNASLADDATQGFFVLTDGFGTRNQFYGGQVGLRGGLTRGRWNLDATAKIAFGSTHQTLNIVGTSEITQGAFGFPTGITPGGAFAQTSNIGTFQRNVFAIVPEVQINLGFQLRENIRPFIGYNFLYLSNAVRPGEQMDRNVNLTQNPFAHGGPTTGAPAPLPVFRSGDFWAQGINFGVELRY